MNVLKKRTLEVFGIEFFEGKEFFENLQQNKSRRYQQPGRVRFVVVTNQGRLHIETEQGFVFDGRSGPKIIDWYVPNLGTFEEKICWFTHDCNGYGLSLSFEDTNVLLNAMLRYMANYSKTKANVIELAVSLSKSWYGEPKPGDWCYDNIGKVKTTFEPKEVA